MIGLFVPKASAGAMRREVVKAESCKLPLHSLIIKLKRLMTMMVMMLMAMMMAKIVRVNMSSGNGYDDDDDYDQECDNILTKIAIVGTCITCSQIIFRIPQKQH